MTERAREPTETQSLYPDMLVRETSWTCSFLDQRDGLGHSNQPCDIKRIERDRLGAPEPVAASVEIQFFGARPRRKLQTI